MGHCQSSSSFISHQRSKPNLLTKPNRFFIQSSINMKLILLILSLMTCLFGSSKALSGNFELDIYHISNRGFIVYRVSLSNGYKYETRQVRLHWKDDGFSFFDLDEGNANYGVTGFSRKPCIFKIKGYSDHKCKEISRENEGKHNIKIKYEITEN